MSDSWKECEGQVVGGEFPLVQHLGGSDHSVVFLTQRGKNKAAIKFIQADAANADLQLARWKQAAQLSHPNLIKLFETGRCPLAGMDLLYVVMEYAQENLAQFLPERPLSPAETRDMLEPFVETLAHLHGQGFVHGRIKPGNILAIDDQLKLSSDSVSRSGEARNGVEKPDVYAAPESARSATAAGDVWSLGVTLVETLTQNVPKVNDAGELQVPDSLPQPFLDITRYSLQRDPRSRWTVADISTRLNPPANPSAPAKAVATSIPDPIKPAPPAQFQDPASAQVTGASKTIAPAKPAASIDPLSVPLSTVPPFSAAKQHALENQLLVGQATSYRSYYIAVAILVALTVGAMIAIPRLRDRQSPDASEPTPPAVQPEQPPTPAKVAPPEISKPQPAKPVAPAPGRPIDGPPQRSAVEAPKGASQHSMETASEKQMLRKESALEADSAANATPSTPTRSPRSPAALMGIPIASPGAVIPGEVLNQVLPEVSVKSRSTIHGTVRVTVKVFVDASGNVTTVEPASTPSKFFGDAALQAAKGWDFAPAKIGTQNVPSEWLVRFDFTQTDTKVLPLQAKP